MNQLIIESASLRACAKLLMDLVDGAVGFAIYDVRGKEVWKHTAEGAENTVLDRWIAPEEDGWKRHDNQVMSRAAGPSAQMLAHSIHSEDGMVKYFLCLVHEVDAHAADIESLRSAHRAVVCLSDLLETQYGLNNELNSMTDELARRYEELNLVYNTDEGIRSLAEQETVFQNIVESCIDHLHVDAAALYLTEKSDATVSRRYGDDATMTLDLDHLRTAILRLMSVESTSVVLNTEEEKSACGVELPEGIKVIAAPIRDHQGRLYGSFVVLNNAHSREFDNGDRNLLSVIAEKLSKIVSADYDGLTGLITREGFELAVSEVISDAAKRGRDICLLHANVDRLQLVNDTFGHDVGDDLIQRIATTLPTLLRGNDCISRLGGDEFGILLLDCSLENAKRMADRVCERVSELKCQVGSRELDVSISIGVTKLDADDDSVIGAMATADLACSVAKEQGRNIAFAYRVDDEEMRERKHQMHWVGKIQSALKSGDFRLYSQVIESTDTVRGRPHFEILLRMLDDKGQILSPAVFLPVAERYHLMPLIDRWVIEHGLAMLEQWCSEGEAARSVFTINLSGQSITDERTMEYLLSQLRKTSVNTEMLCFEITESEAIKNLADAENFIARVKGFGCRFALDDFGAGVSSFANLRALDVDYLKIDGSFVVDMAKDPVSAAMVSAINQVGQTMSLCTVAEFVESGEISDILVELGVDYLQGYYIGKPMPLLEQLHELSTADAQSA